MRRISIAAIRNLWLRRVVLLATLPVLIPAAAVLGAWVYIRDQLGATRDVWRREVA